MEELIQFEILCLKSRPASYVKKRGEQKNSSLLPREGLDILLEDMDGLGGLLTSPEHRGRFLELLETPVERMDNPDFFGKY